jgi:argininosuccinate lyase
VIKLWGGRFRKSSDRLTEDFNASIGVDQRLYRQDIRGSIAHATMLAQQGILTPEERDQIILGLQGIEADLEAGQLSFTEAAEDVHMNLETFLIERIGATGKKLHTARSRNDQVALDIRLYLRDEAEEIQGLIRALVRCLLELAAQHIHTIMPGYTHLQKAQPITLAHHLLAYVQMLKRDSDRLSDLCRRLNVMPLGSGALAGTGFPLDREYVAELLGFDAVTLNSLDGVSDRDFALEFGSFAAILMMHLSRFCEELILWSSGEFAFVELDDAFTTGSSIMPQKKNPDLAELIRGKTGRVYGDLMALLTLMKGLPLAYNKDMQEDKAALFDAGDTVRQCLAVLTPMLKTAHFNEEKMAAEAKGGFTNATDLADYLVGKGVPFRDAHAIVGQTVLFCLENHLSLDEVELQQYQRFHPAISEDIYAYIAVEACVSRRRVIGGPAPEAVEAAIAEAAAWLESF